MSKRLSAVISCLLIVSLLHGLAPASVFAGDDRQDKQPTFRFYTTATRGPIGMIESFGPMSINGRAASGKLPLWGGELLQVPDNLGARVSLTETGQITLQGGTSVRLSVSIEQSEDETRQPALIAALSKGAISVQLKPDAVAYLQSGRRVFTASKGASFRMRAREGRATVEAVEGAVHKEPNMPWRRMIRRVQIHRGHFQITDDENIPIDEDGPMTLLFQVCEEEPSPVVTTGAVAGDPTEGLCANHAGPDIEVTFVLVPRGTPAPVFGTVTPSARTDTNGVVAAIFTPDPDLARGGPADADFFVRAQVEEAERRYTIHAERDSTGKLILTVVLVAVVIAGVVLLVKKGNNENNQGRIANP